MRAATDQARATVRQFIATLHNPRESQSGVSIKVLIKYGDHGEHMWLLLVRYQAGKFVGQINKELDRV